MIKRLKTFQVETTTDLGKLMYLTKSRNGKEALKNLIERSGDYKYILRDTDSNNMQITIRHIKKRRVNIL